MEYVTSTDRTTIAYQRSGQGPALILVHGAATDNTRWSTLIDYIRDFFTIYAIDRRGRGESGDGADYSIERESDDISALASSLDGPVNLYGHSSGALYALEAASKIPNLKKLVLYEPPKPAEGDLAPESVIDELQRLIDAGEYEQAVIKFMRDVARFPEHEIEAYRALPTWPARVATAHTFPRELRDIHSYHFDPGRFSDLNIPVLLLLGEESPSMFQQATRTLHEVLPDCRILTLPGQGHAADVLAPEMTSAALIEFLGE